MTALFLVLLVAPNQIRFFSFFVALHSGGPAVLPVPVELFRAPLSVQGGLEQVPPHLFHGRVSRGSLHPVHGGLHLGPKRGRACRAKCMQEEWGFRGGRPLEVAHVDRNASHGRISVRWYTIPTELKGGQYTRTPVFLDRLFGRAV